MNVIFENSVIEVSLNSSAEVFVKNKKTGVFIRISDHVKGLDITASGSLMIPYGINGLSAILVRKGTLS